MIKVDSESIIRDSEKPEMICIVQLIGNNYHCWSWSGDLGMLNDISRVRIATHVATKEEAFSFCVRYNRDSRFAKELYPRDNAPNRITKHT